MAKKVKAVFISDASSHCGMALARAYQATGAMLALNCSGVSGDPALAEAFPKAKLYFTDVTNGKETAALVKRVTDDCGGIDMMVHNHNSVVPMSIENAAEEQVLESLRYNTKSAFLLTQAFGGFMRKRGSGAIVYVSSVHAEKPTGSAFAYSAGKAAVSMLAKETALDLGRYGVRANVIEVGPTFGGDGLFKSELSALYDNLDESIPGGGRADWEQVASLAVFLTDGSCPFINGETIKLDGGFLLNYGHRHNYEELQAQNLSEGDSL